MFERTGDTNVGSDGFVHQADGSLLNPNDPKYRRCHSDHSPQRLGATTAKLISDEETAQYGARVADYVEGKNW